MRSWLELYYEACAHTHIRLNTHLADFGFCNTFLILKFSSLQDSITLLFSWSSTASRGKQPKSVQLKASVDQHGQSNTVCTVMPCFNRNQAIASGGEYHDPPFPHKPKSPNRDHCCSHDQTPNSLFSNKLSHFKGFINVQIEQELEQVFVSPSFIHWRWHGFFIQWLTSRKADVDCKPSSEDALDLLLQGCFLFIYLFVYLRHLCAGRLWFQGYLVFCFF